MRKFILVALSGFALVASAGSNANAEGYSNSGGFKVDKSTLQKADYYNAPREYHLLDERPILRDFRTAPVEPNVIEINAGPLPSRPGTRSSWSDGSGGSNGGASPFRSAAPNLTTLPKSGFGSEPNFNPNRGVPRNLPNGTSIGNNVKQAVSGRMNLLDRIASKNASNQPKGANAQTIEIANYKPYVGTGSETARGTSTKAEATGRLLPRLSK